MFLLYTWYDRKRGEASKQVMQRSAAYKHGRTLTWSTALPVRRPLIGRGRTVTA